MENQCPLKIKMFLWRLARSSIPTADVLEHKHMSNSDACLLCGARDSWRYALINWSMAHSVWALYDKGLVEQMCQHTGDNARYWLFTMNEAFSHEAFICMAVTLWEIWWAKRKVVYDDIYQSPISTHHFVQSFLADLQTLSKPTVQAAHATAKAGPLDWIAREFKQNECWYSCWTRLGS